MGHIKFIELIIKTFKKIINKLEYFFCIIDLNSLNSFDLNNSGITDLNSLNSFDLNNEERNILDLIFQNSNDLLLKYKNKNYNHPAIVMGLGPSLLKIDKLKYKNCIKITCNEFYKVPNFFYKDFLPDYFCGSNSSEALYKSINFCIDNNILQFLTIPSWHESIEIYKLLKNKNYLHKAILWNWNSKQFQKNLAMKYGLNIVYSHGITVAIHMLAFALWLGCNPIYITGIDLNYNGVTTHAGYSDDSLKNDLFSGGLKALSTKYERFIIKKDLKYLAKIAEISNTMIYNLSYEVNRIRFKNFEPLNRNL